MYNKYNTSTTMKALINIYIHLHRYNNVFIRKQSKTLT